MTNERPTPAEPSGKGDGGAQAKVPMGGGLLASPEAPETPYLLRQIEFEILRRGEQVGMDQQLWIFCAGLAISSGLGILGLLLSADLIENGKPNWWAIASVITFSSAGVGSLIGGSACYVHSCKTKADAVYQRVVAAITCKFTAMAKDQDAK